MHTLHIVESVTLFRRHPVQEDLDGPLRQRRGGDHADVVEVLEVEPVEVDGAADGALRGVGGAEPDALVARRGVMLECFRGKTGHSCEFLYTSILILLTYYTRPLYGYEGIYRAIDPTVMQMQQDYVFSTHDLQK